MSIQKPKTKLFWILWTAGMLGILSFLLVDLEAIIAAIPLPEGTERPELPPPALFKLITLIQPTVIMTIAVLIGCGLAKKVGLHSPAAEAMAYGGNFIEKLRPQIVPGIFAGLASGIAIVLAWVIAKPFLTVEFVARAEEFNRFLPPVTRFLYGGLTEELLLRWGLMTFLVWLGWRIFQKGEGSPKAVCVVASIILSALVFGIAHLPIASILAGKLTFPLVAYVVTANSLFGIAARLPVLASRP